jgi:hypothetical protein
LKFNRDLARRAVDRFLADFFTGPKWCALVAKAEAGEVDAAIEDAKTLLAENLHPPAEEVESAAGTLKLNAISRQITEWFTNRHKREFSDVHFQYGKEAGLIAIRGTSRYRYAPTDQLLKSLVLANVRHEMQMEEFLNILFNRYGLVIGSSQQRIVHEAGNSQLSNRLSSEGFRHNQARFESRLKSMGMLRRLSDSQAYVINPLQNK